MYLTLVIQYISTIYIPCNVVYTVEGLLSATTRLSAVVFVLPIYTISV